MRTSSDEPEGAVDETAGMNPRDFCLDPERAIETPSSANTGEILADPESAIQSLRSALLSPRTREFHANPERAYEASNFDGLINTRENPVDLARAIEALFSMHLAFARLFLRTLPRLLFFMLRVHV